MKVIVMVAENPFLNTEAGYGKSKIKRLKKLLYTFNKGIHMSPFVFFVLRDCLLNRTPFCILTQSL